MTGPQRNDPHHFPAVNGEGHRRRKLVNQPLDRRYGLDVYERRALQIIAEADAWLATLDGAGLPGRGDPGE